MARGAPISKVIEIDISEVLPNFSGIRAGLVGDWERGSVEEAEFSETVKEFVDRCGKPNPRLYGISQYSGINFLRRSKGLWHARVDRGQVYSTLLVRGIIEPYADIDAFGWAMENPLVDPIVKPNGGFTKQMLDSYEFPQYPRTREVDHHAPVIHLTDVPFNGDTDVYVDNMGPLEVGGKFTFRMDFTGLTPTQILGYKIYTITALTRTEVVHDYIHVDSPVTAFVPGTEIQKEDYVYQGYPTQTRILSAAAQGDTSVHVTVGTQAASGHFIRFGSDLPVYEVASAPTADTTFALTDYLVLVTALAGTDPTFTTGVNPSGVLGLGDTIRVDGDEFTVDAINNPSAGVWEIETTGTLSNNVNAVQLFKEIPSIRLDLTSALSHHVLANVGVSRRLQVVEDYAQEVLAKQIMPDDAQKIWVSNNDPVAEQDYISIGGNIYQVLQKTQARNFVNKVSMDQEFQSVGGPANIGSEVYKVVHSDFEERDAFLVYEKSPGIWGNKIAIGITDSRNYEEAFVVTVYYDGVPIPGEEYEVTRIPMLDGYGRQMYIEDKINYASRYIQVINNPDLLDYETGQPREPLKTTYYLRQPLPTPVYTPLSTIQETVFNGDNLIRVPIQDIPKFNIHTPVKVQSKIYDIASFQPSIIGGAWDTIVLKQAVQLDFPPGTPQNQQNLPIGAPIGQSINRYQEIVYELGSSPVQANDTLEITIDGVTFSYTVGSGDDDADAVDGLVALIDADEDCLMDAYRIDVPGGSADFAIRGKVFGWNSAVTGAIGLNEDTNTAAARANIFHQVQRIDGSIIPAVTMGSIATFAGGEQYKVLDAGANRMSGGDDGPLPTIGQFVLTARNNFGDPDKYDVLVLMDGGIANISYQKALVEIAEQRADCVALLSVSYEAQINPDINNGPLQYRRDLGVDSSWAALYSPWVQVFDEYNNQRIWLPIESDAASSLAYLSDEKEIWEAMAGWKNGLINRAEKLGQRYGYEALSLLYDNQINGVRQDRRGRKAIWGQKTLQVRPSTTDRLNCRFGLIAIGRTLREYLDENNFSINDEVTRRKYSLDVDSFMMNVKTRRGVYDYYIVCDESNNDGQVIDSYELYLDVYVKMTKIAEYQTGRLVITRTGIQFQQILLTNPSNA